MKRDGCWPAIEPLKGRRAASLCGVASLRAASLHLAARRRRTDGARILDAAGKPAPTADLTDADWRAMESLGFSVVRLVVHWSRLEPTRGAIDAAYLDRVDAYVKAAAAHGLYTVIDMHQDAWGKHIATPRDVVCPEGTEPAKGWDGAPRWEVAAFPGKQQLTTLEQIRDYLDVGYLTAGAKKTVGEKLVLPGDGWNVARFSGIVQLPARQMPSWSRNEPSIT